MGSEAQQTVQNRDQVISMLNRDLATFLVSYLQYTQHKQLAEGISGPQVVNAFEEQGDEKLEQFNELADRIASLGGMPMALSNLNQIKELSIVQIHSPPQKWSDLKKMVQDDLDVERKIINELTNQIREIGFNDPVTRRMLEEFLKGSQDNEENLENLIS